jgi:transposase
MTNQRVEIITSVQRRRRWSLAEKEQLVTASFEPGVSVSAIARQAGIHPGQLYGWRRRFRAPAGFASVQVMPEATPVGPASHGTIEIEFAAGIRMRIKGAVDAATLSAAIAVLSDGRRR